jgi:alpha-L-arabinofuranosidase
VLITLMNNADRVKAACLAQLVNVIGAIMTESGGPAWRQSIFHPFSQASKFGHGNVLRTQIQTDSYATATHPQLDYLLATVLHDDNSGRATVFALNCHTTEEMNLTVEMRGLGERTIVSASELHHRDIKAANTRSAPSTVTPSEHRGCSLAEGHLKARLRPLSWNVFVTDAASGAKR